MSFSRGKIALQLKRLNPNNLDLGSFSERLFSIIYEKIPYRAGWFFPVDPVSLEVGPFFGKSNSGSDHTTEVKEIHLHPTLFPTIDQLLTNSRFCTRGGEWWSQSKLVRHPFYRTVLKPALLYFALMALLLDDQRRCRGYVVLWREKSQGDFADDDLLMMNALSPVIGNLLRKRENAPNIPSTSEISEEELYMLVRRRAHPGVLILNQDGETLYVNQDAKDLLKGLTVKSASTGSGSLPQMIYQLYTEFKQMIRRESKDVGKGPLPSVNRICIHDGVVYLFRALLLQQQGSGPHVMHILILIEKVSKGVRLDEIVESTRLTHREQTVVRLLLEGKTNKEVAACMNIGEYTVKDHIKRIMKKLNVTTRAGIVANILQRHLTHHKNSPSNLLSADPPIRGD